MGLWRKGPHGEYSYNRAFSEPASSSAPAVQAPSAFKRAAKAALMTGALDATVERFRDEAVFAARQGQSTCTFTVNLNDVGSTWNIDDACRRIIHSLQQDGHRLLGVDGDAWSHVRYIKIEVQDTRNGIAAHPAPTVSVPAPPIAPIEDPAELEKGYQEVLAPLSQISRAGDVFGPGYGLEDALAALASVSAPDWAVQAVVSRAADVLIHSVATKVANFDQYDDALGITVDRLAGSNIPEARWKPLFDTIDESKHFIMSESAHRYEDDIMTRWFADETVKRRIYAYHAVALGRLGISY
jgi:hypothetical protein